jgi:hypothetical protein
VSGQKSEADRLYEEREAALYDPDSLHRRGLEETQGTPEQPQAVIEPAPAPKPVVPTPSLYARAERRRAMAGGLTKEMIKAMADRAEAAVKKGKS